MDVYCRFYKQITLQTKLDVDRSASLNVPAGQGIAEEVPPKQLQKNFITTAVDNPTCAYTQTVN